MDRLDKTPVMSNFLPFRKPLRSLTRISLSVLLCDHDAPVGARPALSHGAMRLYVRLKYEAEPAPLSDG